MTTQSSSTATEYQAERCANCDEQTPHDVSIELEATHNDRVRDENEKFARTPCRVTTCRRCGEQSFERQT
ncbi:hypothetical protein ACFO0N_00290 [Halobium salinum]|uniref:DUF7835 domain-containing protein n=1 Tax=Halobium salinum TaxID=1364940 RepID=A0ABD5P677_9EURY|nr:hypothetical protein [Halobium salinum]